MRRAFSLGALASLTLLVCMSEPGWAADTPKSAIASTNDPVNGNAAMVIPTKEMPSLEREALAGSQEAACRLAAHHNFVSHEYDKGVYWLTIAAENGSVTGMYNLGVRLFQSRNESDRIRARYWLLKVRQLGSGETLQLANELLRELDQQPN